MNDKVVVAVVLALCVGCVSAQAATMTTRAGKKTAEPQEFTGLVSRIVDGDTLWLQTAVEGSQPVVVRIEGIDAPERCQQGGAQAKQALARLALNRNVTVKVVARDDYARIVGKVYDGAVDVGDRMVRDGHAWSARFRHDRGPYVAEERMAIALKRGLHGEGGAVLPRDFRQRHGPCEGDAAHGRPAAAIAPNAAPTSSSAAAAVAAGAAAAASTSYRCDGRKFCSQMTSCQEATWVLKNCPGVKMDGNNDGVPCEKVWCR